MPELPEVETTCRGIEPYLKQATIKKLVVRNRRLRWPIPPDLEAQLDGQIIEQVRRRAKYILIDLQAGSLILHLGMSGSLRIIGEETLKQQVAKHDHFDLLVKSGYILRYNDPRRFGCLLWSADARNHRLLAALGPEPLSECFNAVYLHNAAKAKKVPIKVFIMNQQVVVGVGNIYASEALHLAGISPLRSASKVALSRLEGLVSCIKSVLSNAIAAGGTTLKDFTKSDGKPGYFKQELSVYGRASQPCKKCGSSQIKKIVQAQRATYYCTQCQR